MVYKIQPAEETKQSFSFPDIYGKWGLTFTLGDKELFIGIAMSSIYDVQVSEKQPIIQRHPKTLANKVTIEDIG